MKYLLDATPCIRYLTGRSEQVRRRLRATPIHKIAVCSVVKAEMFYGAMKSVAPQQAIATQRRFLDQFVSLSFDDQAAEVYGRERARLAKHGWKIGKFEL